MHLVIDIKFVNKEFLNNISRIQPDNKRLQLLYIDCYLYLVFRLHWCISSVILLTFSVIITTRQYVGNPIDCIHTKDVPDDVFDLYCWIHSTYTIPRALSLHVGNEIAHPGILTSNVSEQDEKRYVTYYQWVGFCLFFQVCLLDFYSIISKIIVFRVNIQLFLSSDNFWTITGCFILCATMVVEKLGSWQNNCFDDGSRHRSGSRGVLHYMKLMFTSL